MNGKTMCGLVAVAAAVVSVGTICLSLVLEGSPAIVRIGIVDFLAGTSWRPGEGVSGILPMLAGSGATTLGAVVLGVPVGILTAEHVAISVFYLLMHKQSSDRG